MNRVRDRMFGPARPAAFTLIELLVVIAILGILATFILTAVGGVKDKARAAIAASQIKSLTTALEAYNTDVGFYPRDRQNLVLADIPHLLFAALNNRPTTALGGGPNSPYFDVDRSGIGLLLGTDFREALDEQGNSVEQNLPNDQTEPVNAAPLDQNDNPNLAQFQNRPYGSAPVRTNLDGVSNFPAYIDPWGNAYHYREWASKAENDKQNAGRNTNYARKCHNFNTFDIWSNGPDGINNYGHPDSDDVNNWGR